MPTKVPLDDPRARDMLRKVEQINRAEEEKALDEVPITPVPSDGVFQLDGGYRSVETGEVSYEFQVRELTGYDEEALAKIKDPGKFIVALLDRATVRVGDDKADPDVLNSLVAGDWDNLLLAIRTVSFGEILSQDVVCNSCESDYTVEIDLMNDLSHQKITQDELVFTLTGRHGAEYKVTVAMGSLQRKVLTAPEMTLAESTTMLLRDCIRAINGMPVVSDSDIRRIPIADRRLISNEIDARRAGPNMRAVKTKCPECGEEQMTPLNAAALFQG